MEIADDEFGPVVRLISRTSLGNISGCVGSRLDPDTANIPRITMAPPHTDSRDGTRLSISLASTITVDYITVFFILNCRLDSSCDWPGNDSSSTCGCDWYVARSKRAGCARLGSHELDCFSLCA